MSGGGLPEESLEELYEQAPAGYLSARPDGAIVRVNATFLGWTGYAREALVGRRRFQELLSLPGRIYYETHLGPLLAMQGTLNEIAADLVCVDGRTLPTIINAVQKRNEAGEPLLNRFTVFNASDRRRYEKELLRARREAEAVAQAKTELLAMLSHDIRTPLGSIMAAAHILERSPLTPEQERTVRILRSASTALLDLVNQILETSRIEASGIALNRRAFDLGSLVRELVDNLLPLARSKGLSLACHIDERLPSAVHGDPTKIGQVLGNLVGNALKFTSSGTVSVDVSVRALSAESVTVRVRVLDTGIGIEREHLGRIFHEYTQAHEGIAKRYGGSGLGLTISRKLLQAHGSELHVESTPGQGSSFWFDLELGR